MKAMLLAAGLGTRMRPLTGHTPKPLLEAGGKALIVWHLERLRDAGFADFVVNTAWLGEQIEQRLGDGARLGVRIEYSREGTPLETAGGIRRALPLLGEAPFLVVNADIWTDIPFRQLTLAEGDLASLVLVENPAHNPSGDFHLTAEGKVRDNGEPRLTFSGVGVYHPELFVRFAPGEAKLAQVLRAAMGEGLVGGRHHRGQWWDIGTPERLQRLDRFIKGD